MKYSENMFDRWKLDVRTSLWDTTRAVIICGLCSREWEGVAECCREHMPFDLIHKRNLMNLIFHKYNIHP